MQQYKMKYIADYEECNKIKRMYYINKLKAYALLWDRCAKTMQNKISSRADFETKYMTNQLNFKRQF